jgi:hypothetical protein
MCAGLAMVGTAGNVMVEMEINDKLRNNWKENAKRPYKSKFQHAKPIVQSRKERITWGLCALDSPWSVL